LDYVCIIFKGIYIDIYIHVVGYVVFVHAILNFSSLSTFCNNNFSSTMALVCILSSYVKFCL
jgi:hypothetical protein